MNALVQLVHRGGPVMYAIIGLSVILYSRCCFLILTLRDLRAARQAPGPAAPAPGLLARHELLQQTFRHQRLSIGAMIAAAPLLGLLGTVSGMATTFESLASNLGQKSMEGLAGGISEVLVATESGLVVAIPALLLLYVAHRLAH